MDRKTILGLLINKLKENISSSNEGIEMQKEYLADQPGPMQSRYDSALVEGQWQLSEMKKSHNEMEKALSLLEAEISRTGGEIIANGSIIILNQNGAHNGYILLDAKGAAGVSVVHEGRKYTAITPQSPLGKVLAGRKKGDTVEFRTSKIMRCTVEEVL